MKRNAFSLVELLVVIAIIAVLAAILFPVFSSARRAAFASVCLNNFKQAGLAANLYFNDNNEGMLPAAYNGTSGANALNDRRWPQILNAYMGDRRLYKCPADPKPWPRPPATFDQDLRVDAIEYDYAVAKLSNLGYNYLYLAPIVSIGSNRLSLPRTLGNILTPSGTIFGLDSVESVNQAGFPSGGGSHLVVPPCRWKQEGGSQVLDSYYYGQGIEIIADLPGWAKNSQNKFTEYGGAWPWHTGRMNVLFIDGHVKPMTPSRLVAGCTIEFQPQGVIVDSGRYDWDLQ
ncbi:MAG: prepilin-type N-terminal cleavage/methylation domain-containing protein [Chthonomonas sp.]|nr:prepilin-type N-terminal cleavage/methylation domain-containing protein [Chthonomonas sp.]